MYGGSGLLGPPVMPDAEEEIRPESANAPDLHLEAATVWGVQPKQGSVY